METNVNSIDRGCSSHVPVHVLMTEEGDEASSSDNDDDFYQHGWQGATELSNEEEEQDRDYVASCCASGNVVCYCINTCSHSGSVFAGNMTILVTHAGFCYTCGDGCSGQQALPLDRYKLINPQHSLIFMTLLLQGLGAGTSCALTSSTGCRRCSPLTGGGALHVVARTWWLQFKLPTKVGAIHQCASLRSMFRHSLTPLCSWGAESVGIHIRQASQRRHSRSSFRTVEQPRVRRDKGGQVGDLGVGMQRARSARPVGSQCCGGGATAAPACDAIERVFGFNKCVLLL